MRIRLKDTIWGNSGATDGDERKDHFTKWYLSTEGYYFKYRNDKYDSSVIRATLYSTTNDQQVDDIRVSEGYGRKELSHHDVINRFEVMVSMK